MSHRPPNLSVIALLLLLVNFGFDILRRFDLQTEAEKLTALVNSANEHLGDAQLLLARTDTGTQAIDGHLSTVETAVSKLHHTAAELLDIVTHVADPPSVETEHLELSELLTTIESLQSQPELYDLAAQLPENDYWDPEALLESFERRYNYTLSVKERSLLSSRVICYNTRYVTSYIRYCVFLAELINARIFEDTRVDQPHPQLPVAARDDAIAISLTRDRRLTFGKQEYPDLYRKLVEHRYLRAAVVRDIDHCFSVISSSPAVSEPKQREE